jgi:glyoxylase-like metal-dependent hydrolase (beta-lactamase superfamily II)
LRLRFALSFNEERTVDHQISIDPTARADQHGHDGYHDILSDLAYRRLAMVNVVYYGAVHAGDRAWVLIDAGLPRTSHMIISAAAHRFGRDSRPAAIIVTHGHVDHVGALSELAERWDTPIYAHELELPYLDGRSSYPPPDPTVGGGMMSLLSSMFPRGPVDVSRWLLTLPADGSVPGMPGWRWIHTPGHTPGHVSLWRATDRTLIAGDAFITTKQESAYAVMTQEVELHGPPMYFTPDWQSARTSVQRLAALEPEVAITGHGRPLQGNELRRGLHALAEHFDEVAMPKHGRYVEQQRAHP